MSKKQYYVYILTNKTHTALYTGVTDDLIKRVYDHKSNKGSKFTSRYNINILVYYEYTPDVLSAIAREKQIKGGSRKKKEELIKKLNPDWIDLYDSLLD